VPAGHKHAIKLPIETYLAQVFVIDFILTNLHLFKGGKRDPKVLQRVLMVTGSDVVAVPILRQSLQLPLGEFVRVHLGGDHYTLQERLVPLDFAVAAAACVLRECCFVVIALQLLLLGAIAAGLFIGV